MKILISRSDIQERVRAVGQQIEADYHGRPLTVVGILTGSIVFLADLIRELRLPLRVGLVQASSYRAGTVSAELRINDTFAPDVEDRDVLLLDDILDTGKTLAAMVARIEERGANSVKTAVLLRKIGRQEVSLEPDYCCFTIPNEFVVGYGLDFADEYRHLPDIAVLPEPPPAGEA